VTGRGGGWVVAQFVLMGLCFASAFVPPDWPSSIQRVLTVVGAALAVAGGAFAVWAGRVLGRGMTAYPKPVEGAPLVDSGPYALVRHPIYSGALLFFVGWSLFAGPVALALTVLLGGLWAAKAAVEEAHLRRAHPEYDAYAARVRGRLIPAVFR
jgi:protein-S-isoprenylcysteine O-methyltransferase Ste14